MPKYKCIIFDCDGVLVDSEPIGNQVLVDMANELEASIDIDYAYKHFKGNALKNCLLHIETLINKDLPSNFEAEYRRRSFSEFKKNIKPVKGIKQVLDNLKLPFCVASSGPENKIRLNLEATGLLDFFEGKIFSCYTVNKWKPDPEIFLYAAKTMGFAPKECLVVEDSKLGVQAAINGGFDVFGYTAHDVNNELANLANVVFDKMEDLPKLINNS